MTQCFPAGRLCVTCGINELIANGLNLFPLLTRHLNADWGDLCHDDIVLNHQALKEGGRLFSAYQVGSDLTIWIITEADRSATTLLLPSEY
ncbi:plasmid related protein [Erwinia psidii]|uniref:hypothetical protein n=1 Tax=Erwinia psidii TaxID=69224 RepID=UPI00226B9577|nr:hypothetical protein [Erwinia psidii]MCX8967319.1 plasmid related protein [Erwinia psidii]